MGGVKQLLQQLARLLGDLLRWFDIAPGSACG